MSERKDSCRYCGTVAHGWGCAYSPYNMHIESGDPEHCIYCGSTNYGHGCGYAWSVDKRDIHQHGHGTIRGEAACIWCGMKPGTGPCNYSPTGKHEF